MINISPLHAALVVLGDIGRSPRMQYHALSLLQNNFYVTLIGYDGEELIQDLQDSPFKHNFNVIRFNPSSKSSLREIPIIGRYVYLLFRLFSLIYSLYNALWNEMHEIPDCLLVQNPPSIPLMLMSYIYCHTHSTMTSPSTVTVRPGFIIDWHNLGYTMFGFKGQFHPLKQLARHYEQYVGRLADAHFCVSGAMKSYLLQNQFVKDETSIEILRDCPPQFFHKSSAREIHDVMIACQHDMSPHCFPDLSFLSEDEKQAGIEEKTLFTLKITQGDFIQYIKRLDRPVMIISSTSWTPDEDFSILLSALEKLENLIKTSAKSFPRMLVAVTGKGPQKEQYQTLIDSLNQKFSHVFIQTIWLSPENYPVFMGSADLGISLHTSTSGLDLPMKVLDMMGSEVPVCTINYSCVNELVHDDVNGKIFQNNDHLAGILFEVFGDDDCKWKAGKGEIGKWREGVKGMIRWKENWEKCALKTISKVCGVMVDSRCGKLFVIKEKTS